MNHKEENQAKKCLRMGTRYSNNCIYRLIKVMIK